MSGEGDIATIISPEVNEKAKKLGDDLTNGRQIECT
jgi:hypothetical protein